MNKNKPLVIIFLGKSGAGKGTQAKLLLERYKLEYMGSGDLLRARRKYNDFTGKKIAEVINKGGLIPTPIIFKLWMDKFEKFSARYKLKGFLLDGSPRKMHEVYLMNEALEWFEWNENLKVILIDLDDKDAIDRLMNRKTCKDCGYSYPFLGKMKDFRTCPHCGGKLLKRTDDDLAGIKVRLAWFKTEVHPVIDFYKKRNKLIKINGNQNIDEVFEDIVKAIEK